MDTHTQSLKSANSPEIRFFMSFLEFWRSIKYNGWEANILNQLKTRIINFYKKGCVQKLSEGTQEILKTHTQKIFFILKRIKVVLNYFNFNKIGQHKLSL